MKTITNITYPAFVLLAFASFALSPTARAVDPPPDGGYPGGNTAEGDDALFSLTTGEMDTAIGFQALYSNTDGFGNNAIGFQALYSDTSGHGNTANGFQALYSNTDGVDNTANGYRTLFRNVTGTNNAAYGPYALYSNTDGIDNTANGNSALLNNTTGSYNTAIGLTALRSNTTGSNNTATGLNALFSNTIGSSNIALGFFAGTNLTTGDDNIDIGNFGVAAESNTIRIGTQGTQTRTFIAGISGTAVIGRPVMINANGRLGTPPSSARFKDGIKPMDKASEAILALKPVMFRYKKEVDAERTPQFGLVAEQVEKVNADLVTRDPDGKAFTVRYEAVNAMLLNEFLKEYRKVEEQSRKIQEQDATITQFKKEMQSIAARLKEQDSKIQKVSARLEMQTTPAQTVANSQ